MSPLFRRALVLSDSPTLVVSLIIAPFRFPSSYCLSCVLCTETCLFVDPHAGQMPSKLFHVTPARVVDTCRLLCLLVHEFGGQRLNDTLGCNERVGRLQ
ncbi:hypothetical protein EV424DRAFT_1362536 [Suillus variegatus]|nr:hypothetical protein EV424DRAFT_1362536 [Suillus variegatus]